MQFTPKHMERWRERVNYHGDNFDSYFVVAWRFFRCSPTERANFKYIKRQSRVHEFPPGSIIYPKFTDAIRLYRFYILAHQDFLKTLRICDLWAGKIKRRECLDPALEIMEDESTVERSWRQAETRLRMEMCVDAGISAFAARRQVIPPEVAQALSEVHS